MYVIRYKTTLERAIKEQLMQGEEGFVLIGNEVKIFIDKEQAKRSANAYNQQFPDTKYEVYKMAKVVS